MADRLRPHHASVKGETHIGTAFRLLLVQTAGGLAAGGALTGVLTATTHVGLSGSLFVAAIVVAIAGIAWSVGGPRKALPWMVNRAIYDPGELRRPFGTSQADAVLVVSSVLAGLLLVVAAVVARR